MKTLILAVATSAALIAPTAALADAGGYGSQPGFTTALSHTNCAGAGAFGAFGTYGTVRHDWSGGANGPQTGYNNSNLCGNPQGTP